MTWVKPGIPTAVTGGLVVGAPAVLFAIFDAQKNGGTMLRIILLTALTVAVVLIGLQWLLFLLSRGRYADRQRHLTFADFRHSLALAMVVSFVALVAYSLYKYGDSLDNALKLAVGLNGAFGPLLGAIVGYYFGESAAKPKQHEGANERGSGRDG